MPNFNRRGFLHMLGAVGLTPFLPGMSARTAVKTSGASVSKALWASLYANSGSVSEFVGIAKNMGLSNTAVQGVSARSIGVRVALAASTETLASRAAKTVRPPLSLGDGKLKIRHNIKRAFDQLVSVEADETQMVVYEEVENLAGEGKVEESEREIL